MQSDTTQRPSVLRSWGFDRGLAWLVGGALVLIVLGLVAVPLAARRTPTLAPASTPEGVVQRFYQAAYAQDWPTAYSFVSADVQRTLSRDDLTRQLIGTNPDSRIQVRSSTINGNSATVSVTITSFWQGGLFNSGESSIDQAVVLSREGQDWKITSGPFYLP